MPKLPLCLAAALALAGCSMVSHRPEADERPIEIITSGAPKKPFKKVARLDFHVDKWSSKDPPSMADFRSELVSQARLVGADAVTDIDWTLKGTPEAGIYHVVANAISYRVPAEEGAPRAASPEEVEILTGAPTRPYAKVSSLDLYIEKKTAAEPSLEEILPEIKRQARLSGAEAVMDVQWTLRGPAEGRVYHVTGTGISYSTPEASPAPR